MNQTRMEAQTIAQLQAEIAQQEQTIAQLQAQAMQAERPPAPVEAIQSQTEAVPIQNTQGAPIENTPWNPLTPQMGLVREMMLDLTREIQVSRGMSTVQVMEWLQSIKEAVSYTHLTLPTTPYV